MQINRGHRKITVFNEYLGKRLPSNIPVTLAALHKHPVCRYLAVYTGHEEVLLAAHHALEPRALYQEVAGHARAARARRRRASRVARPELKLN